MFEWGAPEARNGAPRAIAGPPSRATNGNGNGFLAQFCCSRREEVPPGPRTSGSPNKFAMQRLELENAELKEENFALRRRVANLEGSSRIAAATGGALGMGHMLSLGGPAARARATIAQPSPESNSTAMNVMRLASTGIHGAVRRVFLAAKSEEEEEAEMLEAFWQQLLAAAPSEKGDNSDAEEPLRPCVEAMRQFCQESQALEAAFSIENGQLHRRVEMVHVYLLAEVEAEQRCLMERSLSSGGGTTMGRSGTMGASSLRPLAARIRRMEDWQEAMHRALEEQVDIDSAWQEKHLEVDHDSYYCFEENEPSDASGSFSDVVSIQKIHEIHCRVRPLEQATPRPSLVTKKFSLMADMEKRALERIGLPYGQDFVVTEGDDGEAKIHVWCWKSREYERTGRLEAFKRYLVAHGVDADAFEYAGSGRSILQLYIEVHELQESFLEEVPRGSSSGDRHSGTLRMQDGTAAEPQPQRSGDDEKVGLRRIVELLRVRLLAEVQKRWRVLTTSQQVLQDGSRQNKSNEFVVQRMKHGENWREAIERAISSKLGVDPTVQQECFKLDESRTEFVEELKPTEDVGGIPTVYRVRTVTVNVVDPKHADLTWIGLPAGNDFVTKEGQLGVHKGGKLNVWTWSPCDGEEQDDHVFVGTAFEELSRALHDAEQLIQQTKAHPQIGTLGLTSPLTQALAKIREGVRKVADIDSTLGDVDVHAMIHAKDEKNGTINPKDSLDSNKLADFISAQFTRQRKDATHQTLTDAAFAEALRSDGHMTEDPNDLAADSSVVALIRTGRDSWGFDLFELNERTNGLVLESYGELMLAPLCKAALSCSREVTKVFLDHVASNYYENPYHNAIHAAQVCHSACWLTRALGVAVLQSPIERTAFAIAALCHDIKHFGRNNAFCVNTEHPMALRYNNARVMENMHAATTWELIQSVKGVNMAQTLNRADRGALRAQIIEYILATDMSEHFEVLSKFRVKLDTPDFSISNVQDRQFVARMCIKAGDIGHSSLPWDLHEQWSVRCALEFYQQGDEERGLGLPISALCDRSTSADIGKSQKGFLEFVCLPLFEALAEYEVSSAEPATPGTPESRDGEKRRKSSWSNIGQDIADAERVQLCCIAEIKSNARRWVEDTDKIAAVRERLKEP